MKNLFLLFITFSLFGSVVISYRVFYPLNKAGGLVVWDVPPGQSFYNLASQLEEQSIIRSKKEMKILIWLFGLPNLQKGEYEISSSQSLWRVFQTLKQAKEKSFLIRFPEGLNHYEMAELLKSHNWPGAEDFLNLVRDKTQVQQFLKPLKLLDQNLISLEGYLFPDSYRLKKYMPGEEFIKIMIKRFKQQYQAVFSQFFYNRGDFVTNNFIEVLGVKLNLHQIVTLASVIEKETGQAKERPLIAGVFYNRLNKNMKLQTDPTVLYAMYLNQGFNIEKNIRKKDLLFNSPYNTYKVFGLPPGPIANPGAKSLQAVFAPTQSDYLYFVSRNDGSHKFSTSYKEHKKAVYQYQIKAFKK